jgi:hypothetical protein
MVSRLSALGFDPTRPRPASLFANQLPLHPPTAIPIPFLFNYSSSLRPRRHPTARLSSLLFSLPCGHFPSQQGGTPPPSLFLDCQSLQSPLFPAIHPIPLQQLTKCSSHNSFVLTTIHFHGGGYTPLAPSLSRAHLSPARSSLCVSVPLWLTSSRRFRPHCHVSLTGPGGLSILMGFGHRMDKG